MSSEIGHKVFRLKLLSFLYDTLLSPVALFIALFLANPSRFRFGGSEANLDTFYAVAIYAVLAGVMIYANGLHRSIWRYTSFSDFVLILRVATLTTLLFYPVLFVSVGQALPRAAPILAWFVLVAFWGAPRIAARARVDQRRMSRNGSGMGAGEMAHIPIVVAGNASRIEVFVRELRRRQDAPYVVVGILTYESEWHGRVMHGIDVLGGRRDLGDSVTFLRQRGIKPQRVILADDAADEDVISGFLESATRLGLTLGRLPRLLDFDGGAGGGDWLVRPIAIGDLLGRPQAALDREKTRRLVAGKRVLVTGAGGSIGAELVRQISDLGPSKLLLVDNSEFNLYSIDKELSERHPSLARRDLLCDVRDRALVLRWFGRERPEIVFHAAALKHVPLVESHALEGVHTNVIGTQNVVDACVQHNVATMMLISTDKAVNPHNVMGATKRLAEAYCQAIDAQDDTTRILSVRFGNVLGSAGSVVPLFQRQLAAGGPLTVTDPEITRYFMTIPEAVALVLQASALGSESPAHGGVYVLDMGKPIKIVELARQIIRLSGKRPDIDVKIEYIGLRPGEKLYEELVHDEEKHGPTEVEGVMIVSPRTSELPILRHQIAEMSRAIENFDEVRIRRLLKVSVPEFEHGNDHGAVIGV
jgi:O-antigen biosynthesis protein WbqV